MRNLQTWWAVVVFTSRYSPPRLVEAVMLLLAIFLCLIWCFVQKWPYLILCLSYILGAIALILARETVTPSAQTHKIRTTAMLSLVVLLVSLGLYLTSSVYGS
jgi:multisubunit Na+/H+ antiporter MnhE subunit